MKAEGHVPSVAVDGESGLDAAPSGGFDPGSNVVDVYVGYLRRTFGAQAISTLRGIGYRFNP